ncbi:MAG: hypothetical protein ACKOBH_03020 [bacterium]
MGDLDDRRFGRELLFSPARLARPAALRLSPIEELSGEGSDFSVTPPWLKRVYRSPEYFGTD